jgi:hypothetical protein
LFGGGHEERARRHQRQDASGIPSLAPQNYGLMRRILFSPQNASDKDSVTESGW